MVTAKEPFSGQAPPELLASIREIARAEGQDFGAVLEDAIRLYVECKSSNDVQPDAVAHFRHSLERNRKLMGLLAQGEKRK